MDNKDLFVVRDPILTGIFKTIYLFLINHNFCKSAKIFKNECEIFTGDIDKVSSKSLLLKKCRCSKNQANQTEAKNVGKCNDVWLEGTYEGEPFEVKDEETHIFYVCDHFHQMRENSSRIIHEAGEQIHRNKTNTEAPSGIEIVKLKSKFSELQGEHQKLIAVTSELTTALQKNIIGQTNHISSVLEQCKSIYPTLFLPASPRGLTLEGENKNQETCPRALTLEGKNKNKEVCPRGLPLEGEMKKQDICWHEDFEKDNFNEADETYRNVKTHRSPIKHQIRKSSPPRNVPAQTVEQLNLSNLSPRIQLKSPLTPETIRHILETVFERIFEIEKFNPQEDIGSPLKKGDVDRIVNDVLNDINPTPSNLYGAGEGQISRPCSPKEFIILRNSEITLDINYEKIKRDLIYSENEKKIRILQALRWRITKNEGPIREKVIEAYVTRDILDLFAPVSLPEKILMGYDVDHYVQESTCRLLNTLASLRQGRDYLTTHDKLLKRVLVAKVQDIKKLTSAVIRNMLVASVQKLSIRKQCRNMMVQEGLFEVIVDYLDEFYEKLSRYCLEYCSALLMNLCLVEEAKQRSTKNPRKVIGLIRKLLEGEIECCLPYVNGITFSLLEKDEIIEEAKKQNLDKVLLRLIRVTNNENIRKQLDFILQSRLLGKGDASVSDNDKDNREEVDLLEVELDQDDFITQLPSGEKLLEEYKTDNSSNYVTFATTKRESPNSAKTFSEENKQFYHKPSMERGIFENTKPRRYSSCSQNLIKNYVKHKVQEQTTARYPATPLCYMETCRRLQEGSGAQCSCSKCTPGQNRYHCGCFDAICREIADNESLENHTIAQVEFEKTEAKNSFPKFVALLAIVTLFVFYQCKAQVTFSKNWEAGGGKRNGHPTISVPDIYFKLTANAVCQYLLTEMKRSNMCFNQVDDGSSVYSEN